MADDNHLSLVAGENKRKIRLDMDEALIHELEVIAQKTDRTRDEILNEAVEKFSASTEK